MENLKANSSSRLETRGLQWYDSTELVGFQWIQELRVIGGKNNPAPEATALLANI